MRRYVRDFNIFFIENVIQEVLKLVIINYMSEIPCSVFQEPDDENDEENFKSEPFSYVMIEIIFWRMRTETKPISKSGVGLKASFLKRKHMYSRLVNVQQNIFDQITE